MKDAAEISETYLTQSKKPVTSVPSSPIHQKCMILNFHIEKHFFFKASNKIWDADSGPLHLTLHLGGKFMAITFFSLFLNFYNEM